MNNKELELLEKNFKLILKEVQIDNFKKWQDLFVEYNSHTNLMSKNDVERIFEKHIFDSLAISLFEEFANAKTLLDVGTGGGFPSVILAIAYPGLKITANDSIGKKIKFIEIVKNELKLKNLNTILGRVEDIPVQRADIVTSRAVGKIKDVYTSAKKHTKKDGCFITYKAMGVKEEIEDALRIHSKLKSPDIISYSLPTDVAHTRNLVIFRV